MVRDFSTMIRVVAALALASPACGGKAKKPVAPKEPDAAVVKPPPPAPETEEDRERKRHAEAVGIIAEGTACLPTELRNATAPRLMLGAVDGAPVVCAIDQDRTRLLGPIACWGVDVKAGAKSGSLTYRPGAPLPGRGFAVLLDDRCARGFCLGKDVLLPSDGVVQLVWNWPRTQVGVLAGDAVHVFDAASKAHESSFSIRGDKGVPSEPQAMHWNADALFVEASDGTTAGVWGFAGGTALGPLEALGGKEKGPLSTRTGSFAMLGDSRVAISEQGMTTLTIYETDTGKRSKLVRRVPGGACKKDELDGYWRDPASLAAGKCKDFVTKNYAHLMGADVVAGTNLLVLLRGPRLGELAVLDAKTLAERRVIKMTWCDAAGGADKPSATEAAPAPPPAPGAAVKAKAAAHGAGAKAPEDPDSGGQ
jgi:hypothetical protein